MLVVTAYARYWHVHYSVLPNEHKNNSSSTIRFILACKIILNWHLSRKCSCEFSSDFVLFTSRTAVCFLWSPSRTYQWPNERKLYCVWVETFVHISRTLHFIETYLRHKIISYLIFKVILYIFLYLVCSTYTQVKSNFIREGTVLWIWNHILYSNNYYEGDKVFNNNRLWAN